MEKVIASMAPIRGRTWRLLLLSALLLTLIASFPLTASADDGRRARFTTTASVLIVDGGASVRDGKKVKTRGEVIAGCITSSTWDKIPGNAGCSPLLGNRELTVLHNSLTTITPTGRINGQASGTFTVGRFRGEYKSSVAAQMDAQGLLHIEDSGTWTAADRAGNEAKGTFRAVFDRIGFSGNNPILLGQMVLNGVHWADD